jgi:hypothetical protein
MQKLKQLSLPFILIVLALNTMQAGPIDLRYLVYDSGPRNGLGGDELTHWVEAESFALTNMQAIFAIRFWADQTSTASYKGSILWRFYADNSGLPGPIVAFGEDTPERGGGGLANIGESFQYDMPVDVTLTAGRYWLGLHNGPLTDDLRSGLFWETSFLNTSGPRAQSDAAPFDPPVWRSVSRTHAFQLFASPDPSTGSLIAVGAIFMAFLKRRHRGR